MKCPKCGHENDNNSLFCEQCGALIGKQKMSAKSILIAICVVLALSVIGNVVLLVLPKGNATTAKESVETEKQIPEVKEWPADNFFPVVIPNSTNLMKGDSYMAQIMLASKDTSLDIKYYVDGQQINNNGMYMTSTSGIGRKEYSGKISVTDPYNGEIHDYPFSADYTVSEPSVSIINTTSDVLFHGVSHKFSISVPGVSSDKIRASASGASISQKGGTWTVTPTEGSKAVTISVTAEIGGRMQSMGSREYRVKQLPTPTAFFSAGDREYPTGNIAASRLSSSDGKIIASYGANGLLDVSFTVTGFRTVINGQTTMSNGNKFSQVQLDQIAKMKKNQMVILQDIRAQSSSGYEIRLNPLVLTVN